jgi:DNA methylase
MLPHACGACPRWMRHGNRDQTVAQTFELLDRLASIRPEAPRIRVSWVETSFPGATDGPATPMGTPAVSLPPAALDTPAGELPAGGLALRPARSTSGPAGRYLPASTAHSAKMPPAIARHAITAYSQPGELVVDPMCGIGTTPVGGRAGRAVPRRGP